MELVIHVDGGARGNPGPAGAGVVITREDGSLVYEAAYYLGRQTNNAAEYHALIRALQYAGSRSPGRVTVHSDSELLVRQLTGEYQVRSPRLAQLHEQVQLLLLKVGRWSIRHIDREQNERADELANVAMDRKADVVVFEDGGSANRPTIASAPSAGEPRRRSASADSLAHRREQAVLVTVTRQPGDGKCPAGGFAEDSFAIGAALPSALCVHAAHALLPTVLAVLNTDAHEFSAVPTMTVRCARPGCRAEFQVTPVQLSNGKHGRKRK